MGGRYLGGRNFSRGDVCFGTQGGWGGLKSGVGPDFGDLSYFKHICRFYLTVSY